MKISLRNIRKHGKLYVLINLPALIRNPEGRLETLKSTMLSPKAST